LAVVQKNQKLRGKLSIPFVRCNTFFSFSSKSGYVSLHAVSIHFNIFFLPSASQGSAADIIKIAMIKIYSEIFTGFVNLDSSYSVTTKFDMLRDRCRILLQVSFSRFVFSNYFLFVSFF